MLKYFQITLFFLLGNCAVYSQWQSIPSGTGDNIVDACFVNDSVGYAIGANGAVVKTDNFGSTWTLKTNLSGIFTSICKAGKDTIYAGGNTLYRSADAGNTWNLITTFSVTISDLIFFGSQNGFAIHPYTYVCYWPSLNNPNFFDDYSIVKTTNGGNSWVSSMTGYDRTSRFQFLNDSSAYLTGVYRFPQYHCAGPSSNKTVRTNNRGVSWQPKMQPIPYGGSVYHFANDTLGFFVINYDKYSIYKTLNGGNTLNQYYTELKDSSVRALLFTGINNGFYIDNKSIYETKSSGLLWTNDYVSIQSLNALSRNAKNVLCFGNNGLILKKQIVINTLTDTVRRVTLNKKAFDFGYLAVDSFAVTSFSLTNTGNVPLNLSLNTSLLNYKISLGTTFQNTLAISLNPFQSQIINLQFNPKNAVNYRDTISINANQLSQVKVPIVGIGFYGLMGGITKDTVICVDTIRIGGNVTVNTGKKVTICPGTVVKFLHNYSFTVKGVLKVMGDSVKPVTVVRRDTANFWQGFQIDNTSYNDTTVFNYTVIKQSTGAMYKPTILVNNGFVIINKCILKNPGISNKAIVINGNKSKILVQKSVLYECGYAAIECSSCDTMKIWNNELRNNGVGVIGSSFGMQHVKGNVLNYNKAEAINIWGKSFIEGNFVFNNGGGIAVDGSDVMVKNNSICNNKSYGSIGGIRVFSGNNVFVIQNLVFNNTLDFGNGAGIGVAPSMNGNPVYIVNNTVCNNKVATGAKGQDFYATTNTSSGLSVILNNNIFYDSNGLMNLVEWFYAVNITLDYNCISSYTYSGNNIMANPQFANPTDSSGAMLNLGNYDWNLTGSSPCINSGTTLSGNLVPLTDIAGKPRNNGIIDMGAFEYYTVGVSENKTIHNSVLLFPNPASSELFISYDNNSTISDLNIRDLFGRKIEIRPEVNPGILKLKLEGIAAGVYFVDLKSNNRIYTYKFIKQ